MSFSSKVLDAFPVAGPVVGNSLSDREVVAELIGGAVSRLLEVVDSGDVSSVTQFLESEPGRVARVLLGQDAAYVAESNWNVPGRIDVRVARVLGLSQPTAIDVMSHAVMDMLGRFIGLMQFASQPGVLDEQWQESWADLLAWYVDLFMGLAVS